MVRNGQVADSFYSLIQPEPNDYNYWCHIIGIPWGKMHFRLAKLVLLPFGMEVV